MRAAALEIETEASEAEDGSTAVKLEITVSAKLGRFVVPNEGGLAHVVPRDAALVRDLHLAAADFQAVLVAVLSFGLGRERDQPRRGGDSEVERDRCAEDPGRRSGRVAPGAVPRRA